MDVSSSLAALFARPESAESTIVDLQLRLVRTTDSAVSSADSASRALAVSNLFNKHRGILAALKTNRDLLPSKAKYLILDFITLLIRKEFASKEHATEINELSAVKKSSVLVLVALVETKLLESSVVEAMTKRFIQAYVQGESKIVSSGRISDFKFLNSDSLLNAVKCVILELYGALVRHYPESFAADKQDPSQLKRRFLTTMSAAINSINPDTELLAGAVIGLSSYLHSFDLSEGESKDILSTIRIMIIPIENQTRYSVPKAGLTFIRDHADKFQVQMCANKESIYFINDCLKKMCTHHNRDISKLGFGATIAFLQQVATRLSQRKLDSSIDIFWYFVRDFINVLNNSKASFTELSQAVKGLGLFSAPCKALLSNKELKELQNILVQKLSSMTSDSNDAKFAHISAFMDAFKLIAKESDSIDAEFLNAIDQISVSMLMNFPKIRIYYRAPLVTAFTELLWELRQQNLLHSFWNRMVHRLLIISCVVQNDSDTQEEIVAESREPPWKEYLPFWQSVFTAPKQELPVSAVAHFHQLLFDGMMSAILEFPENLNLTMRENIVDTDSSDSSAQVIVPISADASKLSANIPADFIIFVNFVSLCEAVLPTLQVEYFSKWVLVAGQKIISYSYANPLVSGFYKLFGAILGLCNTLNFFEVKKNPNEMDHEDSQTAIVKDIQRTAETVFSKYVSQVLLKMRQFKDDLLVSCLKMVLASPTQLTSIENLCLPIVESLKMGLSYTPLAVVALDAVESWVKKLDRKVIRKSFEKILPAFNDYLILELDSSVVGGEKKAGASKSGRKHLKIHKISEKQIDETMVLSLQNIQMRILKFLGSIGQDNKLIVDFDVNKDSMLAWDPERNLRFPIPFKEAIFDIYFGKIVELAEFSPDRKTKIAANELLHALVIIMIGKSSSNQSENDSRSPYHKIYVKLFPILLRLAIDLDKVTRELFNPLVLQLVHWLTKNSKYENPETMALLQSCFDAVSSSNGPLREFGAECIAEYLKWSIKHASEKELENNPINAKSLFKRLYLLCQHSSSSKRMSASIIINHVYTIFRESNALIDVFAVEILYHLLFSLKIADADSPSLGTQQLAKTAIDRIAKIITVKFDIFAKKSTNRRSIPGIENIDLGSLIKWLFEESRCKELEYSYKCIEIFDHLATKTIGVTVWIKNALAKNENYIFQMLDISGGESALAEALGSAKRQFWIRNLRTSLIIYRYLIDRKALLPSTILNSKFAGVIEAIILFFGSLFQMDDHEISEVSGPEAKKQKTDTAFIILKAFEFLFSAMSKLTTMEKNLLNRVLEEPKFFEVFAVTIFEPESIGFDVAMEESRNKLLTRMEELLNFLNRNLGISLRLIMIRELAEQLFSKDSDLQNMTTTSQILLSKSLQAVYGFKLICKCALLKEVLAVKFVSPKQYMSTIFENAVSLAKGSDPLQIQIAGEIISNCLTDIEFGHEGFKKLLCTTTKTKIDVFISVYENLSKFINYAICVNSAVFGEILMEDVEESIVIAILDGIFDWLISGGGKLSKEIFLFLNQFQSNVEFSKRITLLYQRKGEDVLRKFWRRILQIKPDFLAVARNEILLLFWDEFFTAFSYKSSLRKLHDLFDILPAIIVPEKSQKLEECLMNIITEKFPLVSENIEDQSEQFDDYRVGMNRLINSMENTRNSIILEKTLILHLCRDSKHPFNFPFVQALMGKIPQISSTKFVELHKAAFEFSFHGSFLPDNRVNIAKTLLLPMLQTGQLNHIIEFYIANIKEIMEIISATLGAETDAVLKESLAKKSICFALMEIAYKRIPSSELHSATGRILKAFMEPKAGEKEITISLIKAGVDFKKKQPTESPVIVPFRLGVNQAAFNAVCACLLATQNIAKVEIFNSYLFAEKPLLWENIVDTNTTIVIKTDLEYPLVRVGVKEFSEKQTTTISRKSKYLSTQFFAESSLSQSLMPPSSLPSTSLNSSSESQGEANFVMKNEAKPNEMYGDLELDVVNQNVCMKGFISVINRLPSEESPSEMPIWMKSLHSKIERLDTHINIRLFIVKLIINLPKIFTKFAAFWWRPVAKLIHDANSFGSGINYFVQDLCLLLMEWTVAADKITLPQDGDLILKTLRWLVKNCNHDSKSSIRNNLRIVRALIENWKNFVVAPSDVIFEYFSAKVDPKVDKYANLTGIYVMQAFIANGVAPYNSKGLTDRIFSEIDLYTVICGLLLTTNRREIYSPLAECTGAFLAFLESSSSEQAFLSKIEEACARRNSTDEKGFIFIVNRISVHYPKILRNQYKILLNAFPRLDLEQKGKCLEAILSWADMIPGLFTELVALDIDNILRSMDEELQTYLLGIFAVLAPSLTATQIAKFLPTTVEIFLNHPSDRYDGIRFSLLEFFNTKVFNNLTIFERAAELLSTWYIPEVEEGFLKYSVHFLLEASRLTPVFDQKIYDRALPDARFNDKAILVDLVWEKSSSMLPLFAATQGKGFTMEEKNEMVRMTQDIVWTPTQDTNPKATRAQFSLSESEFDSPIKNATRPLIDRSTFRGLVKRSYATKYDSTHFAYDSERKKKEKKEVEKFTKSVRHRNVTLYRKYREGELPDIEISNKEILEPLQSISARDSDIARQILSVLMLKMSSDEPNYASLKPEILSKSLQTIFKSSTLLSPPFIGSLLELMLNNPSLIQHISPTIISRAASGSFNFELGALVIEKGVQDNLFDLNAKKHKSSSRSLKRSPEGWVQLAKLFKDLKNNEVYESVYQSHISSSIITKEAITAEMLGNYELAKQRYLEGLMGESLEANDSEPTLWTVRRLECMNKLSEWSLLASSVMEDLEGNVGKVWDETKLDPYLGTFAAWSAGDENPVIGFVKETKTDFKKFQILEKNFGQDLITSSLFFSKDLNLARHYVEQSLKNFITSYTELSSNAFVSKIGMMTSLQQVS
ncbi:hypothetical protein HK100_011281 [Physocladia obscura]|uniref:DNA-dependent protein kinase catalytic subunit CC3 domain-containing protein n=1 Tax=Physocladia obscura TaxID=109957 RepID=A0AAD5TB90_9FUNG|nr:hypothetical protein HK100_011281 [Physocladia obscura]